LCDPHGACGFESLKDFLGDNQVGVFLETAHPAKFTETVEEVIGKGKITLPEKLVEFMKGEKKSESLNKEYQVFKSFLVKHVNK